MDPAHESVNEATRGLTLGLAGHALFETFSVLTRLPGAARVRPQRAAQIIEQVFPSSVMLPESDALLVPKSFARSGVAGGAVYNGLVGLAARVAGIQLLSRDARAATTYAALGVDFRLI